ncbi:MAG TPA: hypothetical protein VFU47_16930 [Armatimonadota bacterium]|nr:hypothetical protein [Armatimonadota bacterium]
METRQKALLVLGVVACAGTLLFGAKPAAADPPGHAPAWGHRRSADRYGYGDHHSRDRYDRDRCDDRYDRGSYYNRGGYYSRDYRYYDRGYGYRGRAYGRPGDIDGDGIRNGRDWDIDGDGIRNERDHHPRNPVRR